MRGWGILRNILDGERVGVHNFDRDEALADE